MLTLSVTFQDLLVHFYNLQLLMFDHFNPIKQNLLSYSILNQCFEDKAGQQTGKPQQIGKPSI